MEKIIFESKYTIAKYNSQKNLFIWSYLPESSSMRDEEWKDLIYKFSELLAKYKPKYIIDDNRNRYYAYTPEMQQWTIDFLFPNMAKYSLQIYVQIVPTDFVNILSANQISQMVDLKFTDLFKSKFVKSYEEAIKFLDIESS